MIAILGKSPSICFTADLSTSRSGWQFQVVTASILHCNSIVTFLLSFWHTADEPHTSELLNAAMANIVSSVDRPGKLNVVVTDGGANYVKAFNWMHIGGTNLDMAHRCFCHKIHNAVTSVLPYSGTKKKCVTRGAVDRAREFVVKVGVATILVACC